MCASYLVSWTHFFKSIFPFSVAKKTAVGVKLSDYTSVKWLLLTGVRLDIPGLTLSDLKSHILGVFTQLFPWYAGEVQCCNLEH